MRTSLKAAIAAMALAGAAAAATPAAAQQFGLGIGPNGGITFSYDSGGYCDQWGCPDNFWNLPVYYGAVFYAGQWYDGPVYYRDWYGRRQYWIRGSWRNDEWRGPHPNWWREGRYGPALGMDYYRQHNFHGRWDRDRGFNQNRNFNQNDRGDNRNGGFGSNGGGFNRNAGPNDRGNDRNGNFAPNNRGGNANDYRGLGRRNGFGGQPQSQPQAQPQNGPARDSFGNRVPDQGGRAQPAPAQPGTGAFDPRLGRGQRYNQPQGAPAPAATPAPAAPAPAAAPDNGDRRGRRGDRGDRPPQ